MSETTPSTSTSTPAETQINLIASIKAKIVAELVEMESAAKIDLSKAKAEILRIGTEVEGFGAKIEAWLKAHF